MEEGERERDGKKHKPHDKPFEHARTCSHSIQTELSEQSLWWDRFVATIDRSHRSQHPFTTSQSETAENEKYVHGFSFS